MSKFPMFDPPPKPASLLGWHRPLSPSASVKVSPLALGGISLGQGWSSAFGKNEDPFALLDAFYALGGNFIDSANTYNGEESERWIGKWMEERGVRDQMVIVTKFSAGYKAHDRKTWKLQSNYTGASAKSLHVSLKESLQKLRTDYVDILYVHWWDNSTSVAELMTQLHTYITTHQVLYLGASDLPAWYVVKANEYARSHGLTPFSIYQGRWNAAFRDMEAEIIPMCEDQGMGIVPWAALGGGQLLTAEQRKEREKDPDARQGYGPSEDDIQVCEVLERIAKERETALQAIALAYLQAQTPYVVPIVGVQSVSHVHALPDALRIRLTPSEVREIHAAKPFNPLFPMTFNFDRPDEPYRAGLGLGDNTAYRMAAWVDGVGRGGVGEWWKTHEEEAGAKGMKE